LYSDKWTVYNNNDNSLVFKNGELLASQPGEGTGNITITERHDQMFQRQDTKTVVVQTGFTSRRTNTEFHVASRQELQK
jgi:hypothetical protein